MEIIVKSSFKKDVKRLKKRNKDFKKLETAIGKLLNRVPLEKHYKNHPLIGDWKPCWELHIEPDWLLIYDIDEQNNQLILFRMGSHSDLF